MPEPVFFDELATPSGHVVGVATLDVPKTLNSLTLLMVDSLYSQLLKWREDDRVVAVFLRGGGEKAFCAGGDVQALHASASENPGGPCVYAETFFEREYRLDYLIHRFPKPVICWGHGIVMGGGLGLFAGSTHRIVTERTRVAMPEITIALYPDVGGSWFLNRMPGKVGLYTALTAASLNAADMLYIGLADHYMSSDLQQTLVDALVATDWNAGPASELMTAAIGSVSAGLRPDKDSEVERHREHIDKLCSGADLCAVVDAILADQNDSPWLEKGRAALATGSPIAAHTIWQQLNRARGLSLEAVFQFELMLSTNVVRYPEFAEGVRALLIDKDKAPKWQFASVAEVPDEFVSSLFEPPWPENPLANIDAA